MMQFVSETNIFEFDKKLWLQLIGTAIGTGAAPTLANLFMAVIMSVPCYLAISHLSLPPGPPSKTPHKLHYLNPSGKLRWTIFYPTISLP